MLLQELNDLKDGDQVVYNGANGHFGVVKGTILTRKKNWMDDDLFSHFTYLNGDNIDFHFFSADSVEFIETGIKE